MVIRIDKGALGNPEDTMWNIEKTLGGETWTLTMLQDNTQFEKCVADQPIKISFPEGTEVPGMPTPILKMTKDKAYLPDTLDDDGYANAFLSLFGATLWEQALFDDTVDKTPLVISPNMFKTRNDEWFIRAQGLGKYLLMMAETLKNPDEVWLNTFKIDDNAYGLERTYLKNVDIDGKIFTFAIVFRKTGEGWRALTFSALDPELNGYDMFMIYFRAGERLFARKSEDAPKADGNA